MPATRVLITLTALCGLASAQPGPSRSVVLTALPGNPAAAILEVDPATGAVVPLGGFPLDALAPIAIAWDRVNGDVIVALQDAGFARIVRLTYSGTTLVQQRELTTIAEPVVDLGMDPGGDVLAGADGPTGGVFLIPRMGGAATRVIAVSNVTSLHADQWSVGVAARQVPGGLPELVEFYVGGGFVPITNPVVGVPPGTRLTGAFEMGTALVRHLLTDDQGNAWIVVGYGSPVSLGTFPPGGTVEAIPDASATGVGQVLGGAVAPNLVAVSAWNPGAPTVLAGPLPGDPVDVTSTLGAGPRLEWFGSSCPPTVTTTWSGAPQLGSTVTVGVQTALPNAPIVLALGLSDSSWGALTLPFALPGGCQLLVSGDALFVETTSPVGFASRTFPIPNQPALTGSVVFGQWVQANGPTYLATSAFAAHLYP